MSHCTPPSTTAERPAVILFAHGSRDRLWHLPIEAVRTHIERTQPGLPVCCAYLELSSPDLAQAAAQLIAQGARHLNIVPMFLGTGKHAREDLPLLIAQLRAAHPGIHFHHQAPIGEDPRMTALMAHIATETDAPGETAPSGVTS